MAYATLDPVRHGQLLSSGASGERVSDLQQALADAGMDVTPTGRFDAATAAAVRAFQRSHGCAADGIVGPATMAALDRALGGGGGGGGNGGGAPARGGRPGGGDGGPAWQSDAEPPPSNRPGGGRPGPAGPAGRGPGGQAPQWQSDADAPGGKKAGAGVEKGADAGSSTALSEGKVTSTAKSAGTKMPTDVRVGATAAGSSANAPPQAPPSKDEFSLGGGDKITTDGDGNTTVEGDHGGVKFDKDGKPIQATAKGKVGPAEISLTADEKYIAANAKVKLDDAVKVLKFHERFMIWFVPCNLIGTPALSIGGGVKVGLQDTEYTGNVSISAGYTLTFAVGLCEDCAKCDVNISVSGTLSASVTCSYTDKAGFSFSPVPLTGTVQGSIGVEVGVDLNAGEKTADGKKVKKDWLGWSKSKSTPAYELVRVTAPGYQGGRWVGSWGIQQGKDWPAFVAMAEDIGKMASQAWNGAVDAVATAGGDIIEGLGGAANPMRATERFNENARNDADTDHRLFEFDQDPDIQKYATLEERNEVVDAKAADENADAAWVNDGKRGVMPLHKMPGKMMALKAKCMQRKQANENAKEALKKFNEANKKVMDVIDEEYKKRVAAMRAAQGHAQGNGNALSGRQRSAEAEKHFQAGWQSWNKAQQMNKGDQTPNSQIDEIIGLYNQAASEYKAGLAS